jgi:hypothetical protein
MSTLGECRPRVKAPVAGSEPLGAARSAPCEGKECRRTSLSLLHTLYLFGTYCSTEKRSTAVCGPRIPKAMLRILGSDLQAYLDDHKLA